MAPEDGLYIVMISVHGLVRSSDMELGRDADTGGQVKYVVELAQALSEHSDICRVDLLTRLVVDSKVDSNYAQPIEEISPNTFIIRIPCGPRRYLRKEVLWPYMDSFADRALQHIRRVGRLTAVIHGHYADAGYIGSRIAGVLDIPLVFTGHSLGRVKKQRLLDQGMKAEAIEKQYNINRRIEAEEQSLDSASWVVASTKQEVNEQYSTYDNYQPGRMVVIPPGVQLDKFYPPNQYWGSPAIKKNLDTFLKNPNKPMILALSRPDPRKNISSLIHAYGKNPELRKKNNLIIVAGNRDDITTMDKGARSVLTEMLLLIDRYELYGCIAYPKHHESQEVADIYRLATKSGGIFVNPALTEPFGLTLIEAAASGLPIIATEDGGPRDITANCKNGLLIDPLDIDKIGRVLLDSLNDKDRWLRWKRNGISGAHRYYSWDAHIQKYVKEIKQSLKKSSKKRLLRPAYNRLPTVDRILICDIDNSLLGDKKGLRKLMTMIRYEQSVAFGIATGRRIESAIQILKKWKVPIPDLLITAVGTEIHYGPRIIEDNNWLKHIDYGWNQDAILQALQYLPGLTLQPKSEQSPHKISYFIDPIKSPGVKDIIRHLRRRDLKVNVIYSNDQFLDILPIRASKGLAVRYFAMKWGLPLEHILVAGDSGNDEEMLRGNTLAVVVGNYSLELEKLRGSPRVYFARGHYAWGIIEGLDHYHFFGDELPIPEEEPEKTSDD